MRISAFAFLFSYFTFLCIPVKAQSLTFVELNCENLFDYQHDEGTQDEDFLPESLRHWTRKRYWRKLNNIAQELISCSDDGIPDLIALCEVENDSVVRDLTRRSLLRNAGYDYVLTSSPDLRGIDVALLYSPFSFALMKSYSIRVSPIAKMRPTRDILYACGLIATGSASDTSGEGNTMTDTLHVFVVHAPSQYGGERYSRPFRDAVASRLCQSLDSLQQASPGAKIIVAGDFNEAADAPALSRIYGQGLRNATAEARGQNGVKGTYRYKGEWGSIDHILVSPFFYDKTDSVRIHSPRFLLEEEHLYGGYRPRRTYNGMRYQPGYSDHLPLVARFRIGKE